MSSVRYLAKRMACKSSHVSSLVLCSVIKRSHGLVDSARSSTRFTGCVARFLSVFGRSWMTYRRHWTKHMTVHCWISMRRSENLRNGSFCVSLYLFVLFASMNLRRSSQSSSSGRSTCNFHLDTRCGGSLFHSLSPPPLHRVSIVTIFIRRK